ncbi:glycosyltransferase family 2 protein [Haliea sp. E17]|uniref:glycosyltransferase family 2 protein n=1 Tax=Haliea sp. E17 TaxID=3401576 RepID=UPI003AABAD8A
MSGEGASAMPLVTVAIPVFNEQEFLREALGSLLAQRLSDLQIMVCDNCSTDQTYSIAQECQARDARVKVIRHAQNIGAVENFKFCLGMIETKYFVWMGGHDVFSEDYLAAAVDCLERNPAAVMAYPRDAVFIGRDGEVIGRDACSAIDSAGVASPVERLAIVVRGLKYCTNIHGVFRTPIARRLPFERVIGPDNLQLAATALYGEIRALDIVGIYRREARWESSEEIHNRRVEGGIYNEAWYDPLLLLIWKHIALVLRSEELKLSDKLRFCLLAPRLFRWYRPMKRTLRSAVKRLGGRR